MPLCDEQIILEELNQFPEQILSRERSQAILKGVREEGDRLQKVNKRRMYYGWMAKGLITCGLLLGFFWMKPFSAPAESTSSAAALTPEEQTYFAAAQKAIQDASGIQKTFPFREIEKDADSYNVQAKDQESREAIVTFKPGTTEVLTVFAKFAINELPKPYHKYVETAQEAFKDTKQQVTFQKTSFFKSEKEAYFSFWTEDRQYVLVDFPTNKVSDFTLYYNLEDVDQKIISIAQTALMRLSNEKNLSFTQAQKRSDESEDKWLLINKQKKYEVMIGANTGQVYEVSHATVEYKIKALNEVIPVTKPLIQDIFGIDISGYTAYGGRDWGGYILRSPGKPSFSIQLGNLDAGDINRIEIE
ncbi:hypothetical protein [Brevibacillus sp. DP1.3A]|uniref:hypothetical protein n=1 Tax=Brevibacillus sp. DP1.3A TaxID=2738867 RepID=UPI00156BC8CC|nr:hypothetical protein [Brevibacillus sp. DP1.3A]UED74167.1 hypothetical protein HP399_026180 [Brevibacillus sp. DP1.3A]